MSGTKIWLVAQAPDGTMLILPHRTAAKYDWASVTRREDSSWELTGVWGWSQQSVSKRTASRLPRGTAFEIVSVVPMENAVPELISAHFGSAARPVVRQVFSPARGWFSPAAWATPSVAYLRTLHGEGITAIGVGTSGTSSRIADFQIEEIIRPGRLLFGGSLIGSRIS